MQAGRYGVAHNTDACPGPNLGIDDIDQGAVGYVSQNDLVAPVGGEDRVQIEIPQDPAGRGRNIRFSTTVPASSPGRITVMDRPNRDRSASSSTRGDRAAKASRSRGKAG